MLTCKEIEIIHFKAIYMLMQVLVHIILKYLEDFFCSCHVNIGIYILCQFFLPKKIELVTKATVANSYEQRIIFSQIVSIFKL